MEALSVNRPKPVEFDSKILKLKYHAKVEERRPMLSLTLKILKLNYHAKIEERKPMLSLTLHADQ